MLTGEGGESEVARRRTGLCIDVVWQASEQRLLALLRSRRIILPLVTFGVLSSYISGVGIGSYYEWYGGRDA
jgi:NhaP-type Na+/H+ or K+/H+ antiporter